MGRSVVRDRHRHGAGQGALGDCCAGFMVRRREWQYGLVAACLHRAAAIGAVGGNRLGPPIDPRIQPQPDATGAAGIGEERVVPGGGRAGESKGDVGGVAAVRRQLEVARASMLPTLRGMPPIRDMATTRSTKESSIPPRLHACLTLKEQEVLRCFLDGMSVNSIAAKFSRSASTISTQKQSAYRKLGIRSDCELFKFSHQFGEPQ